MSTAHRGRAAARKIVYKWQRAVLDSVTAVLSESIPAPSSKPNLFTPSDWNDSLRPVGDTCVVTAPQQTPPPRPPTPPAPCHRLCRPHMRWSEVRSEVSAAPILCPKVSGRLPSGPSTYHRQRHSAHCRPYFYLLVHPCPVCTPVNCFLPYYF